MWAHLLPLRAGDGGAAAARTALAASAAQMGALKGDLAAAKRREDELGSRLAALEVEVASLRGAKADLSERVLELTERLQVTELMCWRLHATPWGDCMVARHTPTARSSAGCMQHLSAKRLCGHPAPIPSCGVDPQESCMPVVPASNVPCAACRAGTLAQGASAGG